MNRKFASVSVGIAVAAMSAAGASPATAATTYYSSCSKLHSSYPYGVAKSSAAAAYQVKAHNYRPSYTKQAQNVYYANYKRLDRDKDGTACEVSR